MISNYDNMNLKRKLLLALTAISILLYLIRVRLLGVYNPKDTISIGDIEPIENSKTILFWNLYWIWEDFDMKLGNEGKSLVFMRLFSSLTPYFILKTQ